MSQQNNLALYKFDFKCGRREPNLTGLFLANSDYVDFMLKHKLVVYFGEVAGKHSEVYGNVEPSEIIFVSNDPSVIKVIQDFNLETGHNPMHYQFMRSKHGLSEEDFSDLTMNEAIEKIITLNISLTNQ